MKKIIIIVIYIAFNLLWSSCSKDFLERENPETLAIDNFFKTEEDFRIAMAGVYNVLVRSDYYNVVMVRYLELASDDAQPGDDPEFNSLMGDPIDNFYLTPENFISINIFLASYVGIARANVVFSNIRKSQLSEEFKNNIEAEARFLRALFYFNLVRLFGDVPMFLEEVTDEQDIMIPRTPVARVYEEGIIPDLLFASENLPRSWQGQEIARVNQWAAKALLAKVYITIASQNNDKGYFQEAREELWEIIQNGPFSLEEKYEKLFDVDNSHGKESIFEISYLSGQYFYRFEGIGTGNYIPQRNGIGSYYNLTYSPRFQGGVGGEWSFNGWGICVPTTSNDNRGNGNYAVPHGTGITEAFQEGDRRKRVTILDYYHEADSLYRDTTNTFVKPPDYNLSPYNVNKYTAWENSDNGEADDNFYILRLADVYLMFAEAENEINNGPTELAYEYLNRVRRRAYGLSPETPSDIIDYSGLSYTDFLENVYVERRLELAFEGHRWFDLIRRPEKALEILHRQGKTNATKERLLLPVPQYVINEMNTDEELITQNPGY